MNKQILDELMDEYRETRQRNGETERLRKEEIMEKCPDIGAMMEERHAMVLRMAAGSFSAVPQDPEAAMTEFNLRIRDALVKAGYPEDYLQPVYTCEKCCDTGYVGEQIRVPCDCLKDAYRRKAAGFGQGQTFEDFDETVFPDDVQLANGITQREQMRRLRRICEKFADALPKPPYRNLVLTGGSGLGKTYLLSCIAARAGVRGVETLQLTAYKALTMLRDNYFGREEADELFDVPVLLLDDLGMEPMMQNVTIEQIYNLINERMSRGLCTVITTNLSMGEIKARYNERIYSRLQDTALSRVYPMAGKDIRIRD
ncbi:MAG: hypothetical protein CW338_06740 [Clostridiales bacterium]|nr:hypothetical protein [Clostridiales bacterium]